MTSIDVGDQQFATNVGTLLSFLPEVNFFTACLSHGPTVYHILKVVTTVAQLTTSLRTFKFKTCSKGLCVISGDWCQCDESTWVSCNQECYGHDGVSLCKHSKVPKKCFWYMPIRDRLFALLSSDIKNLFEYESFRQPSCQVLLLPCVMTSFKYLSDFSLTSLLLHFDIILTSL